MSKLFVIGDLHLSFGTDKPMDIFGAAWENHGERLRENWERVVSPEDVVVVNGDLSWGLKLSEALPDLQFINSLPGKKILMKGNHELWWNSLTKLNVLKKTYSLNTLDFFYNNAIYLKDKNIIICGTRGWKAPEDNDFDAETDGKILAREILRFGLSLNNGKQLVEKEQNVSNTETNPKLLVFTHFPPFSFTKRQHTDFMTEIENCGAEKVYFGHIHGNGQAKFDSSGNLLPVYIQNNVEYYLTSADFLNLCPAEIKL